MKTGDVTSVCPGGKQQLYWIRWNGLETSSSLSIAWNRWRRGLYSVAACFGMGGEALCTNVFNVSGVRKDKIMFANRSVRWVRSEIENLFFLMLNVVLVSKAHNGKDGNNLGSLNLATRQEESPWMNKTCLRYSFSFLLNADQMVLSAGL